MGDKRATPAAVKQLSRWIRSRSVRQLVSMASIAALLMLIFLKVFVKNYTLFYIAVQLSHSIGLLVLVYKLTITKTCSGLSLKTQELTAIYLVIRFICHFVYTRDIYIVLDSLTLVSTLWVIYMIRIKLKNTYLQELDNMPLYYVLVPAFFIAFIGNPGSGLVGLFYMYSKIIEAVSVLPQLRVMQNAKMVEPFTAHYVFALGVARFFACANWIILLINSKGAMLTQLGRGQLYIMIVLLSEVVQTFILADFCYYYVKSVIEGQRMMKLPSLV